MILKNIKKLKNLLENYDKIMLLIEKSNKSKDDKRYSYKNTPKFQKEFIWLKKKQKLKEKKDGE